MERTLCQLTLNQSSIQNQIKSSMENIFTERTMFGFTERTFLTDSAISGPIPSPGKRVARIGSPGEVPVENDCPKAG